MNNKQHELRREAEMSSYSFEQRINVRFPARHCNLVSAEQSREWATNVIWIPAQHSSRFSNRRRTELQKSTEREMKRKVSFQTTRLTTARDCERARTGQESRNCPVRAEREEITRIEPQFIKCAIVSRYRITMRKVKTEDEQRLGHSNLTLHIMPIECDHQNIHAKTTSHAKIQDWKSPVSLMKIQNQVCARKFFSI